MNKHHVLQKLYWPEKKAKERCDEVEKVSPLLEIASNNVFPFLSKKEEVHPQPNPKNDKNGEGVLEDKIEQLSEKIVSLEKLVQRLVMLFSSQQTKCSAPNGFIGPSYGKTSYIVTPIFRPNPFIMTQSKTNESLIQKKDG